MKKIIFFFLFSFLFLGSFSQKECDSLLLILKKYGQDSNKVNTLNQLSREYYYLGDYKMALDFAGKADTLSKKIKFLKGEATALKNIGNVYHDQSNYTLALNYYLLALKINTQLNNKLEIAKCNNNIGGFYKGQSQYKKALQYQLLTLKAMEELHDSVNLAKSCNNTGDIYSDLNKKDDAIKFYLRGLLINQKINYAPGLALSYLNIGQFYDRVKKFPQAIDYFFKSLQIRKASEDLQGVVVCYAFLSEVLMAEGKNTISMLYADSCLALSKEIGDISYETQSYALLSQANARLSNYENAYHYQKLYKDYSDSIFNADNSKQLSDIKTNFEVERKETELKAKAEAQEVINSEEKKRQQLIIYSVAGILLLVIVFSFFLYKRFKLTEKQKIIIELKEKQTQQQNEIITEQKHLVEEKHKEITDSINYAERIQRSFLASKNLLDENLNEYFVLFKPKDVVSGDFYWATKLHNNNFALVTADSTGHGVPGAIMSILNISSLEKAVEKNICEPSEIFNKTRKTIIERLKKDGSAEGGKDGMDASLICFDFTNMNLIYSAANNPVWIVRENELIELVPDKMPVGKHDKDFVSFSQNNFKLQKKDVVYTITDGFPDQFGGEKGKKFMSKNLKKILQTNSHLPLNEQKEILEEILKKWVGDLEQIDDVTIIGIRI